MPVRKLTMPLETKNRIEDYIEQHELRYKQINNQEERERSRTKIEKSDSNQSKINSNQKRAHYV
jgi:hypothetical protein